MKKRRRTRKSTRTRLIDACDDLMLEILKLERGERCEICGGTYNLGLFHILPKGIYKRIRYHKMNLLVAGWFCCHYNWHHVFYIARDKIYPRIVELRGENFEDELRKLDITAPPLSESYLSVLEKALKKELKELERGWQYGKV